MSDLLEKLGFKKRTHVGISLSANNFIELVCVDRNTKTITRYASGNIKYNNAIREIIDYDEFTEVVEGLFEEAGLEPKECSVTLNLPNVHFGITSLDSTTDTPYIIENLQGEIEDLYIFKRNEPVISYSILDSALGRNQQNIVFSALQAKVIGRLLEIFDMMEVEVVRIDNAYSSLLKAIQFCDRFNKHVQKEERTSILLVTPNSCCTFYMNGNCIVDCFEEPLAVKSFSTEEVYSTISKIAQNNISKNNPMGLLIISETDEVNAELLASRLEFSGEIDCINKSINASEQFIDVSGVGSEVDANMITYLTIEAVGAAVADYDEYPLNINFVPPERISANLVQVGDYEVELFRLVAVVLIIAAVLGFIVGFAIKSFFGMKTEALNTESRNTQEQITVFQRRIKENSQAGKGNVFPVLKKLVDNNVAINTAYNLLSTEIPDDVYIKRFVANVDGGIGILGEAKTSELVDVFATGLKEKNKDLMVTKLSVNAANTLTPVKMANGFTFEIKTQSVDVDLYETNDIVRENLSNAMTSINNVTNVPVMPTRRQSRPSSGMTPPPPVI